METEFAVRSKVWIEDKKGNPVFESGRYSILEAVDRLRSLQVNMNQVIGEQDDHELRELQAATEEQMQQGGL